MQSIKNLVNKRRSAVMTDSAPNSARPSEDKAAEKVLAEHHEGAAAPSQLLSPPARHPHRGHRRNLSEATAATASARSSMDITPAEAQNDFSGTKSGRSSRRVSQQIEWENALPGMKPPMARALERSGAQGFTSSGVMGFEGLGHDVL